MARSWEMNTNVRSAARRQLGHELEDLRLHRHVERRRRLVEHDDGGVHRQRAGDGDPLGLAAGQLVRPPAEDRRRRGRRGRRARDGGAPARPSAAPAAIIGSRDRLAGGASRAERADRDPGTPSARWRGGGGGSPRRASTDVDAADLDAIPTSGGTRPIEHAGERGLARSRSRRRRRASRRGRP